MWPAGQFYVLGGLFRLLGDMRLVVAATSLAGIAATVYLASRIGTRLWEVSGTPGD